MGKKSKQSPKVYNEMAKVNAFGVDISENMIAVAKEHYPNVVFAVGSCVPLDFENESMNVCES